MFMKKFFMFIATLFVASSMWAYDFEVDGIYYKMVDDGVEVTYKQDEPSYSGSITIPSSVTYDGKRYTVISIGSDAFSGCSGLTSVTIPNSVTSIGRLAFGYCSGLTSITIPNSVTSIGQAAFINCRDLTSVAIPNSVTSIGESVFENCNNLISVTIPNSVTSIGDLAFGNCSGLTSITIPNSVTSIGEYAFTDCSGLTSVTISNSVTFIGGSAFSGCSGLTSVTIPNNVTSIGNFAFLDCTGLTSIAIPNSVTTIGRYAFNGCTGLTSITIPSSVTKVEEYAFSGCTALKDVTCLATVPPTAYANSFENYNGYLYIPCESKDDYDFASCWGSFKHVECIGAEPVELTKDEVAVVPEKTKAVFSMPKNESANSYTLTISNNGVTFCTLTFNAQGQLANIDFSTNKSYELKSGVEAFQFTVTGLSTAEDYGYSFKALASNKSVLKEYSGSFTTKNEDGTGGSVQGGGEGSGQGSQGGSTAVSEVSNANAITIVSNQILVNGVAPAFVVTVSGKKTANANLKAGVYFVVADGNSMSVVVR
ncbi:MAG: leucine-rich repeat domain-containing protein [Bacteroidales bacterium]|nr:leucine-rich repeat domain-containing protein [Bacteroidales bacterium]